VFFKVQVFKTKFMAIKKNVGAANLHDSQVKSRRPAFWPLNWRPKKNGLTKKCWFLFSKGASKTFEFSD